MSLSLLRCVVLLHLLAFTLWVGGEVLVLSCRVVLVRYPVEKRSSVCASFFASPDQKAVTWRGGSVGVVVVFVVVVVGGGVVGWW